MAAFRDLINTAAAPVDNTASTGQAAYRSMALQTIISGIVKSTEDLLSLTRKIRELWVVGPLKAPGAQDAEAEQAMQQDAEHVFAMLNAIRDSQRQRMLQQAVEAGGGFTYERADLTEAHIQPAIAEASGSKPGCIGQAPSEEQTQVKGEPQIKTEQS
ncbi:hypothetical protein N657DRAFT_651124 [Parathielavia appendiculata]|uniref:Uncharacterized protein n=1 Tax=Parathielavia appendiculata TaxID=2587402 RepID=A0AAN6TQT3_9PEZI|nr:hypothetical protein N657DRAFT_651124 [Parathielavia appendiculata]